MKIALVFTPLRLRRNWSTLVAQDEGVGIMPPLSLAYVASVVEKAGHTALVIDAVAEKLSVKQTAQRIKDFAPDMLGFTLTTFGFGQTLEWIKQVKSETGLPVMVGGWHLSLYPEETMQHKVIDYAVIGEAENILKHFLSAIASGGPLNEVPGIAFRDKGAVVITKPASATADLDSVPFPARHLLKNELYYNILSRKKNFTVMLSAKGCPYNCVFCDLNTKKFRVRSALNFVDEVEVNYRNFGIREFDIYDSSFVIDKNRVNQICEEIMRRNINVAWTARARIDNVDKDMLLLMRKAGCNTLMYGIESSSPAILESLNKYTGTQRIKQTIKWTKEAGIKALGFFMIGLPGETRKSALDTIRFSKQLGLDYVQFTKLTPFPNTEIYRRLMGAGFGDYWREFTLNPEKERELPLVDTEITPREAIRLVRLAYLHFYFRPSYILRAIKRTRSLFELKNSLSAASGLLCEH